MRSGCCAAAASGHAAAPPSSVMTLRRFHSRKCIRSLTGQIAWEGYQIAADRSAPKQVAVVSLLNHIGAREECRHSPDRGGQFPGPRRARTVRQESALAEMDPEFGTG